MKWRKPKKLGAGRYIKKPVTLANIGLAIKEELEKWCITSSRLSNHNNLKKGEKEWIQQKVNPNTLPRQTVSGCTIWRYVHKEFPQGWLRLDFPMQLPHDPAGRLNPLIESRLSLRILSIMISKGSTAFNYSCFIGEDLKRFAWRMRFTASSLRLLGGAHWPIPSIDR